VKIPTPGIKMNGSATTTQQWLVAVVWGSCCLGGVDINVLATRPKCRRFETSRQGDGFLRVIKIHSTPSFGWEVKLEVPRRKILQHVKDPLKYQRY